MKLVSDWRNVWRYYSTQFLIAIAALPLVWASIPLEVQEMLPAEWRPWLLSAMGLAGAASRLVKQVDREDA